MSASTLTNLVTFTGYYSTFAFSEGLALDADGDLFGGLRLSNGGIAFEIANTTTGYATALTPLATFTSAQGGSPSNLILNAADDLFGTTQQGGTASLGTVFEIVDNAGSYSLSTVVSFSGSNGEYPQFGLISDAAGDLFGTTNSSISGSRLQGGGTVFEIVNNNGSYSSTPTTLYTTASGFYPDSPVLADAAGDLFGEAGVIVGSGAQINAYIVYELTNTGGGIYNFTTLASFDPSSNPSDGLVSDREGDLFGVTSSGGTAGQGTVFEIAKTPTGYASTPITLVTFTGSNGSGPDGALIIDAAGDLFGNTESGGQAANGQDVGTVFEVIKTNGTYSNQATTLANFDGTNGSGPLGALVADASGDLFGSTAGTHAGPYGLQAGVGTVFELTNTGYVPCYLQGTEIATPTGARAIETLSTGDLILTASGQVQPVKWIGHRQIDASRHSRPANIWPIRIVADAFGKHVPNRDLFLSPEHAVFIDGKLIPARLLVNEATVTQHAQDHISYWHIELERHDILLAAGLPCESYLDTGNRHAFAPDPTVLRPEQSAITAERAWAAQACAPLIETGPDLAAIRAYLADRACDLGYQPPSVLDITIGAPGCANVTVPPGIDRVRLLSPSRRIGQDRRLLGALITGLQIDGTPLPLDDARLLRGFHDVECHAAKQVRWTDGTATFLIGRATAARSISIEVAA